MYPKCSISEPSDKNQNEVRFGESPKATRHLFETILKARVANGDRFVANIRQASKQDILSLATLDLSASSAPIPRMPFSCDKAHYYRIQALAALNHTKRSPFCTGDENEKDFGEYIKRFTDFPPLEDLSPSTYLFTLHYLDIVQTICPEYFLHSYNAHRLVLAAFVVALKYHEDREQRFSILAAHECVTRKDLSYMEMNFLQAMQFNGFLSQVQFEFLERDAMFEAIEICNDQSTYDFLVNENISGAISCKDRAMVTGTRRKMPSKVTSALVKTEYYNDVYLETDEDVRAANHMLLRKAQQKWTDANQDFMASCRQAQLQAINYNNATSFEEAFRIAIGFGIFLDKMNIYGMRLMERKLYASKAGELFSTPFSSS